MFKKKYSKKDFYFLHSYDFYKTNCIESFEIIRVRKFGKLASCLRNRYGVPNDFTPINDDYPIKWRNYDITKATDNLDLMAISEDELCNLIMPKNKRRIKSLKNLFYKHTETITDLIVLQFLNYFKD